ncbi:MAG TPA: AAA family ATPase [Blastocatellia bacterium]|nr:AAA family ATPase [Blastocatellia bacterium]
MKPIGDSRQNLNQLHPDRADERGGKGAGYVSEAISVVVIGRSLTLQERTRLRTGSQTPLSILAELPFGGQTVEEINRLHPQAALIMLNGDFARSFQFVERIKQESSDTLIVCSSEDTSPDVILQSFRSGATEFLRQPLTEEEINAVFARIEHARVRSMDTAHLGRVVAVYSSKGGGGATFVTANLAASLARLAAKKCCIVDLNMQAGDQPLYLGLEPVYSMYDVVRNFDRLDDQLLSNYLTHRSKHLTLLASPSEIDKEEEVRAEHVTRVISMLRAQASYVLLDTQHMLNEGTIAALDAADDIVLLMTLDIPAIRSAKRALDVFTRLGYDRKRIKVILNRFTRTPEFEISQIEKVLDTTIYATLSNDYRSAIASVNVGEPLVLSRIQSRLVREFSLLASSLSGIKSDDETPAPTRSGWFFSRK